jgi:hypothetical protein
MPTLVFTQLASDNFTPNANPLNPANWTVLPGGFNALQALSGFCQDGGGGDAGEVYTGVVFPLDQYMQMTLNALNVGDLMEFSVRQDAAGITSDFIDLANNGNGTLRLSVFNGDINPALYINPALPFSFGDTFRIAAVGASIYVYHNGILLTHQIEAVPQTGIPAPGIFIESTGDNRISNFSAGSVISIPDPRITTNGSFPNRIVLNCAPLTGPFFIPGGSPPVAFDPRRDLACYADGLPLQVISFNFDSVNNRYLIFTSVQFDLQGVVQVQHHMPSPPFVDSSSPPGTTLGGFSLIATYVPSGI